MALLDDLVKLLLDTLITSIAVVIPAAVSGYFLLRSHHVRVKAELKIRAGTEEFLRKQAAYDEIWTRVYDALDFSQRLIDETNWRIARATQTSQLLTGSPDVVRDFNAIMDSLAKEPATQEELNKVDLDIAKSAKKLWNDIRKDLYNAEPLPEDAIRFIGPGMKTKRALGIWGMNKVALERAGIYDLEGLSKMDTQQVSRETGLRTEALEDLKLMASRELRYWKESQQLTRRGNK